MPSIRQARKGKEWGGKMTKILQTNSNFVRYNNIFARGEG
jgi:hypothetical protein